ncbi:PAS domain-containing protein [Crateriforma conspicua]|uniref:Aerotaxis receptor n=1 Tax=Crateriforma conspicua TaxID=2527996 RepID=A0A5C5Y177_9PLAN|nr:PAS domain-containing protein [Crateriforma conspicua]TWT68403.1 Aerotaxis receptor [Crateriforma conspicua]
MNQPRSQHCIDQESPFGVDELFFSTTDRRGVIRFGNEVFIRVSKFKEDELIGKAHSIIRHPDMPRGVFRLFWQLLENDGTVAAYVKNRAKDGSYYWVMAFATKISDGHLSVRLKPTSELLETVIGVYDRVRQIEIEAAEGGASKDEVSDIGLEAASREIQQLGFADYPSFMRYALSMEMASRRKVLAEGSPNPDAISHHARSGDGVIGDSSVASMLRCNQRCTRSLDQMLDSLAKIRTATTTIQAINQRMSQFSDKIGLVAINARVSADSAPREAIAVALAESESENREAIAAIHQSVEQLVDSLDALSFELSAAALQSETNTTFLRELHVHTDDADSEALGHVQLLTDQAGRCADDLIRRLQDADDWFAKLAKLTECLQRNAKTLRFVRMAGVKESASLDESHPFRGLFDVVNKHIQSTIDDCGELRSAARQARSSVAIMENCKTQLIDDMASMNDQSAAFFQSACFA